MVAEGVEACLERGHSAVEAARVEVARFERLVVAVDGALGLADLTDERVAPFLDRGAFCILLTRGVLDGLADEGAVAVDVGELAEHGGFELLAGKTFSVAALAAELLATGAGVVVVGATVAGR